MVRRILSSTAGLAAVIFVVLAVSAAGFWYRQKLLETYSAMEQSALTALSLGLAAVVVWIAAFTAIAFAPVTPLRRTVLWASSVSMLAGVLGLLSFYDVYFGSLSWVTLGGEVSLGGRVGEMIAGPPGAIAVARVAALFLLAAAAAMPSVTKVVGIAFGRFAVASYAAAASAFGKLASALSREKREEPAEQPVEAAQYASSADLAALLNERSYESPVNGQYDNWESTEAWEEPVGETIAGDTIADDSGSAAEEMEPEPAGAFHQDIVQEEEPEPEEEPPARALGIPTGRMVGGARGRITGYEDQVQQVLGRRGGPTGAQPGSYALRRPRRRGRRRPPGRLPGRVRVGEARDRHPARRGGRRHHAG